MKNRMGRVLVVIGVAISSLFAMPAQANLIINGSFESGVKNTATPGVCSDTVSGWSVSSLGSCGGIDWISSSLWTAQIGDYSIDLNSFNTGAISQSFATVAGNQYQVSFHLAGNPGQQNVKNLDVLLNGVDLVAGSPDFSFNNAGTSESSMGWTLNTFTFTASSAITSLEFQSLMGDAYGPALDNVSVVAVPEPETYALMLAGLALLGFRARRNNNAGV